MTAPCYKPGRESGTWYELKALRDCIDIKEAAGKDATFERGLYKAWIKDPEYKKADAENIREKRYKPLSSCVTDRQGGVTTAPQVKRDAAQTVTPRSASESTITLPVTPPCDTLTARCRELSAQGASTRQIAELLKLEGIFVSHMNVQRRLQGALI